MLDIQFYRRSVLTAIAHHHCSPPLLTAIPFGRHAHRMLTDLHPTSDEHSVCILTDVDGSLTPCRWACLSTLLLCSRMLMELYFRKMEFKVILSSFISLLRRLHSHYSHAILSDVNNNGKPQQREKSIAKQ